MSDKQSRPGSRTVMWLMVLAVLAITAVTVYAVLPQISLNSPTSFPVDI